MKPKTPLFSVLIAVLLLALSGLACNINITTDNAQIAIGDASPTVPSADQPPPAPPPTEVPSATQEVEAPTPTPSPTATLVVKPPQPLEAPPAEATSPTEPPSDTPEEAPPTPEPQPESPPESPAAEAAPIEPLEIASLDPRGQGLGHVGTFRQRMMVQFTSDAWTGTFHYDAEVNTGASAVHMTLSVESPATSALPSSQVEAIWIGDRLWLKLGNQPWALVPESVAEAQFEEQMFAVDDFLPYAPPARRVMPDEVVNGVLSHHYIYNVQGMQLEQGTVSGKGDIYTAVDGGYVVHYTLDGSGTFGEGFEGSGTWHLVYDTYDVGAPITINPPPRR